MGTGLGEDAARLRHLGWAAFDPLDQPAWPNLCLACGKPIRGFAYRTSLHSTVRRRQLVKVGPVCAHCYLAPDESTTLDLLPADAEIRPCGNCGLPVARVPDPRLELWTCSVSCRIALWRKQHPTPGPVQVTCAQCGATFTPRRSTARTCSAACRQKAYRQRRCANI
jgi:hypothetical protein